MQLTIAKAVTSITLLLLPGVMALPANPLGNILGTWPFYLSFEHVQVNT